MPETFGIEEEYLLVDAASGALVPRADALLAQGIGGDAELSAELNDCQIEVATGVCHDLDEAEAELRALRAGVRASGEPSSTRPAALASHPFSSWRDQQVNTANERYARLERTFQRITRQQAVCGCHIHVGLHDPDLRVAVMTRIRPWLPALLALSANSPYWEGADTGYASYRTVLWNAWPTATMPPPFDDFATYQAMVDHLERVEAIDGLRSLYWYVRPSSQFDTLELRLCDVCLEPADAITIAGLARALVSVCAQQADAGTNAPLVPLPVLESAVWRAARFALSGTLVTPDGERLRPAADVVGELLAFARPALDDAGDTERVAEGVHRMVRRGTGAEIQRGAVTAGLTGADLVAWLLGR